VLLLSEFIDGMLMIKIACLFALASYILSILSFMKLKLPESEATVRADLQRLCAYAALLMCAGLLICIVVYNLSIVLTFFGLLAVMTAYYLLIAKRHINHDAPEEVEANTEGINIIITKWGGKQ